MNLWIPVGKRWEGGIDWEFGTDIYTLVYLKQITNKDYSIPQGALLNIL